MNDFVMDLRTRNISYLNYIQKLCAQYFTKRNKSALSREASKLKLADTHALVLCPIKIIGCTDRTLCE